MMLLSVALTGCVSAVSLVSADGDYRGTSTRFLALEPRNCPRPRVYSRLPVRSGTLFLPWVGQYVQVSVRGTGSVIGSLPGGQVTGTYDGTVIKAKLQDGRCGLEYTLKREPG